MTVVFALFAVLGALVAPSLSQTTGETTRLMLKTLQTRDAQLRAAAVVTSVPAGFSWGTTLSSGLAGAAGNKPMALDSCVAMGPMSEVLVAYAAHVLLTETGFTTSFDDAIDPTLAPGNLTLQNPTTGTPLSYKMLMTHRSTIRDTLFDPAAGTAPTAVGTLEAFVNSVFVTSTGTLNAAVFSTQTPGTSAAFLPSRINPALLAYILERVIAARALAYADLKAYITAKVLVPLRMHSTFFLETNGAAPGATPTPNFTGTFTGVTATDAAFYSAYFAGCAVDQLTAVRTHPAYPADYMGYTTAADLARLAMRLTDPTNPVQLASAFSIDATNARRAQSSQGLGVYFFNPATLCAATLAPTAITACPLNNVTSVVGYAAVRGASVTGFFCSSGGVATQRTCTAVAAVHSGATAVAQDSLFALAGAAAQELYGSASSITVPVPEPLRTGTEEDLYGVWVFLSSYGMALLVFVGTILVQYFVLPPALAPATNANALQIATPKRD